MGGYRARTLSYIEQTLEGVIPRDDIEAIKRRLRVVTGDAWDEMRRILNELEAPPIPGEKFTEMDARLRTLELQILEGGADTVLARVEHLEQRRV